MYRRYLYDDRLLPVGGFLQRENKLAEILDGIDIVVRSRGNSVSALGYHTGPGYFFVYLHTWEVSADTRLSTLTHLYLDSGAGVEVLLEHAETSGSYLAYRVGAVLVEILVQTAFAGVVVGSQLLSRSRKGLLGVKLPNEVTDYIAENITGTSSSRYGLCLNSALPFSS